MNKVSKDLNMVIRINDEDGNPIIVHSTPLPTPIFEANWQIFREAYDDISSAKSMATTAVLAKRILLQAGENLGKKAEVIDILRSIAGATFVYTTSPKLLDQSDLSDEMKDEVLSRIVFFTVSRRHIFPSMLKDWISAMKLALNLELTSSTATECWPSEMISTTTAPIESMDTSYLR